MRISKHIVSFDGDYFQILQDELNSLHKNICKKFKEKIVGNCFAFGLVVVLLKKIVYRLLPFNIYCQLPFCQRGSETASKCNICTRFFI